MDMRYGNQLVTTAVVFDINRMNGVGDVLHMIRTFSDIYGQRYGEGSQAPEAGIRVQTIRVAAYVDGDAVQFESLEYDGERTVPTPISHRKVHFVERERAGRHTDLRRGRARPPEGGARSGDCHHREHHLSRRTDVASRADTARSRVVPQGRPVQYPPASS